MQALNNLKVFCLKEKVQRQPIKFCNLNLKFHFKLHNFPPTLPLRFQTSLIKPITFIEHILKIVKNCPSTALNAYYWRLAYHLRVETTSPQYTLPQKQNRNTFQTHETFSSHIGPPAHPRDWCYHLDKLKIKTVHSLLVRW